MAYRVLTSRQDTDLVLEATDSLGNRRFTLYEKMSDLVKDCRENGIDVNTNDFVEAW